MKNEILLSILIPTYKRPNSLIKTVVSCITENTNVEILVNSNCPQKELKFLENFHFSLKYSSFDYNKGFSNNILYLLQKASGKFSLFLSDEDYLDKNMLNDFLKWLEINKDISVGFCDILNQNGSSYFKSRNSNLTFNYIKYVTPYVHTYISGYIINNSLLEQSNYQKIFFNHQSNAYPHVILKYHLLKLGRGGYYRDYLVIKGEEVKFGGEAYLYDKSFLNHKVYGSYARSLQFLYLKEQFSRLNKNKFNSLIYKINLTLDFYIIILNSNSITNQKDIYLKEFSRANQNTLIQYQILKKHLREQKNQMLLM